MDLLFHKNKIKKFTVEYQKPYFQRRKRGIILLSIHFALLASLLVLAVILVFHPAIAAAIFILYSTMAIYYYVKIYKANQLCKDEYYRLLAGIITEEQEIDIEYLKDSPRYRQEIKATRLVNNGDTIGIYKVFKFNKENITGLVIDVYVTRSQGKSSITILQGFVYLYEGENSIDIQIRNDTYRGDKCKKEKELSTRNYSVYSFDEQTRFEVPSRYFQNFNKVVKLSPQETTAIDFQGNKTAVYVKRKNVLKIPRLMDDQAIKFCCQELIKMVDLGKEIGEVFVN
ncbi:MAG TPA: hypothetical protein VJZ51_01800 [Bacilli bacterium]|nr:hypothetical protein [Bacilli bacterium]